MKALLLSNRRLRWIYTFTIRLLKPLLDFTKEIEHPYCTLIMRVAPDAFKINPSIFHMLFHARFLANTNRGMRKSAGDYVRKSTQMRSKFGLNGMSI